MLSGNTSNHNFDVQRCGQQSCSSPDLFSFLAEGVFKAKSQPDETAGAEVVQEGGETEVERPVDQEEAQEVVEEETEKEEGGEVPTKLAKVSS